jgi:hypothetical protein
MPDALDPAASLPEDGPETKATEAKVEVMPPTNGAAAPATVAPQVVAPPQDTQVKPSNLPPFIIQSNQNAVRWLKALIYGEYGSGKTFLVGTASEIDVFRDVLFISTDVGELTLFDPDSQYHFDMIDIVSVFDYKTLGQVHEFLKAHCALRDRASNGDKDAIDQLMRLQKFVMPTIPDPDRLRLYKTAIVDSLAEAENQCMMQLLGVGAKTMIDEEVQAEGWDQYRMQRNMIHRLIRNFRNLPMNILFTCPRQYKENEQKRRIYGPMMTGKLASEVQGFVDLVGHLVVGDLQSQEAEEGEVPDVLAPRRLYIQPGTRHAAKSRFTRYKKPYFDNPTIKFIGESVGLLEGGMHSMAPIAVSNPRRATTKS